MYAGGQNIDPGILPFRNGNAEDYATASFYRVKVEGGDNQIIVRGPGVDENDLGVVIIDEAADEPPPLN